jgi:hypothetical protein
MESKNVFLLAAIALGCIAAAEHHLARSEALALRALRNPARPTDEPHHNALLAAQRARAARSAGAADGDNVQNLPAPSRRAAPFSEQSERPDAPAVGRSAYTASGMPAGYVPGSHLPDEDTYDQRRFRGRSVRSVD